VRRAPVVVGLAALFGAADQFLGSLSRYPWAHEASLLSAPWLLVGFLAGCTQRTRRRAALLGLACTFAALIGYWVMTLSPIEGARLTAYGIRGLLVSQSLVIVGGLVTGPVCGWLGNRWRDEGLWLGALAVAAAFCLEPLARAAVDSAIRYPGAIRYPAVWMGEVAGGLAMALSVAIATRRRASSQRASG